MSTEVAHSVDLIKDSLSHLLAVSFARSRSPSYPLAVSVARGAEKYGEVEIGKNLVHLAAFAKSQEGAGRALTLVNYVGTWKTTQVFTAGRLLDYPYKAVAVLSCFLEASECNDRTAHCHRVIGDEQPWPRSLSFTIRIREEGDGEGEEAKCKTELVDRYLFPCTYLLERGRFRFQDGHPATPEDQIQAAGVKAGCHWCPNFRAEDYRKLGTTITSR